MKLKKIIFITISLYISNLQFVKAQQNKPLKEVSIQAVFENVYSGGACPAKGVIDSSRNVLPLKNSTVLLKKIDNVNDTMSIVTNHLGIAHARLAAGSYYYFMTDSYDRSMNCRFDPTSVNNLNQCFGLLTIEEDFKDTYNISFRFGSNSYQPIVPKKN